jgi:hypothetical protein
MKYLLIFVGIFIFNLSLSQDHSHIVGITFQPFFFKNYNKDDWNNRPKSYPDNPNSFNGYTFGFIYQKNLNSFFSIKSELAYSNQIQYHISTTLSGPYTDGERVNPNVEITTQFHIIKLPIIPTIEYEFGFESGYFVSLGVGIQLSHLADFLSLENVYDIGFDGEIHKDFREIYKIEKPKSLISYWWDDSLSPPGYRKMVNEFESRIWGTYNLWLFGAIGEIELKKLLFYRYLISIGYRFEYDFTNSERHEHSLIGFYNSIEGQRPKTHNIRNGLSCSILYIF